MKNDYKNAVANRLHNDPYTISSSVPWNQLVTRITRATSRVAGNKPSQNECTWQANVTLKRMDKTMLKENQHIGSSKALRPQNK